MHTTIRTPQRSFITDPQKWVGKSAYFEDLFSGKGNDKQLDGSYFVESDDHIFEHILRYLRTGILPVFYDKTTGHDFQLYQALLGKPSISLLIGYKNGYASVNTGTLLRSTIWPPKLKIEDPTENTLQVGPTVAHLW